MVLGGAVKIGAASGGPLSGIAAPAIALLFLIVSATLLRARRKRHGLAVGAGEVFMIVVLAVLLVVWLGVGVALRSSWLPLLATPAIVFGAALSMGTTDDATRLWLALPRRLVSAAIAGSATLAIMHGLAWDGLFGGFYEIVLAGALVAKAALLLVWLVASSAGLRVWTSARLWVGVVGSGLLLPLGLLRLAPGTSVAAGALAVIGLWIHEDFLGKPAG